MRGQAEARVAENDDWIFADGVTRFAGFIGLSEARYFIEGGVLCYNFWDAAAQRAKVFEAGELIIADNAPGLDYDPRRRRRARPALRRQN